MPTYSINIDGKTHKLTSEETMSDDDISAYVDSVSAKKPEAAKKPDVKLPYSSQLSGKGALDVAATLGSGAVAGMAGGIAGAGRAAYGLAEGLVKGKPFGEAADEAMLAGQATNEAVQGMGWQPKTEEGKKIMGDISRPIEKSKEFFGGLTDNPAGSAILGAIPDALMAAGGVRGALKMRGAVTPAKPLTQIQTAVDQAQRDGFMAEPSVANPSLVNKAGESVAGSQGIRDRLAVKNMQHASNLVKDELGLQPGDFLNGKALEAVRLKAAQAYDRIKSIQMDISASDPRFQQALRDIDKQFESVKEFAPGLIDLRDLERVRGSVGNPQSPAHPNAWTPKSLLEVSQQLRAEAQATLETAQSNKSAFKEAAAMKAAATAMEDLLENALTPTGVQRVAQPFSLVSDFRKARELIAKSYDVEEVMNPTTGVIDAAKLAKMHQTGKKLSGNLLKIAEAASAMPDVMKLPSGQTQALMRLTDLGVGAGAGAVGAAALGLHGAAIPAVVGAAARPIARAVMSSKPYQAKMGRVHSKPGRQFSMGEAAQATGAAEGIQLGAPDEVSPD